MIKKILFWWVIFIAVCVPALFIFPRIDKAIFPDSFSPGAITVLGVGLAFTIVTILLFFSFYKEKNLTNGFFYSAIVYSILVILTRFVLAPLSLYNENFRRPFVNTFVSPISFYFIALGIFLLYFLAFWLIYRYFKKRTVAMIENPNAEKVNKPFLQKAIKIFGFILLIGVIIAISAVPLLLLLGAGSLVGVTNAVPYLFFIFSSWIGILMALSLIGAILFVTIAFKNVSEQAIKVRDAGIIASFFWIGASILFIYSALWFVYILIITSLWPLKTFVPYK